MQVLVDFIPKDNGLADMVGGLAGGDISKLASGVALDAAALEALAGFTQAKNAAEGDAAAELQAQILAGNDPNAPAEGEAAVE